MKLTSDGIFTTSDFPLAVALAIWFPIETVDRSDPRRAFFGFPYTNEVEKTIIEYKKHELLVEPQAFYQAMRDVKSRLYSG